MNTTHKSRRLGPWMSLVASIVLVVWLAIVIRTRAPIALPATASEAMAPQSIAALAVASPTPRPTPSSAPTYAPAQPGLTPPPGGLVLALTPDPDGIGWVSDLNGRMQVSPPGIHVGLLNGYVYQGALQFNLSSLPRGAAITQAALELTGLDASRLSADAPWRLELLSQSADAGWDSLSYDTFHELSSQGVVTAALTAGELGPGKVNTFPFGPELLHALQERAGEKVSFRVVGPGSGADNLFTWDSGYRLRGDLGTKPTLALVVVPVESSYIIVTSTPAPENVVTVAAMASRATEVARTIGTYTPVPKQWVTPVVVTPRLAPANAATDAFEAAVATAEAFLYGTPTSTPPNVWTTTPVPQVTTDLPATPAPTPRATATPTSTPTPVFVLLQGQLPPLPPTRAPVPTPLPMPKALIGKIAFLSDRAALAVDPSAPPLSNPLVYVINPDGTGLALLTDRWPYDQALKRDPLSADQQYRAFVKDVERENGKQTIVFYRDNRYNVERAVTTFGSGIAYDPVWSPSGDRLALVSTDSGNDEIWTINRDGSNARQLTRDPYNWWDKRPSWSPDGKQLVFWSNRSGKRQIWIMDADGQNLRTLSMTGYNDWDPVWIKYEDPPRHNFEE